MTDAINFEATISSFFLEITKGLGVQKISENKVPFVNFFKLALSGKLSKKKDTLKTRMSVLDDMNNCFSFSENKFAREDIKLVEKKWLGFGDKLRHFGFDYYAEYDDLFTHAKLIDDLFRDLDQKKLSIEGFRQHLSKIDLFLKNNNPDHQFEGEIELLNNRLREMQSLENLTDVTSYFGLLIFSLFAHLDVLSHIYRFPKIEPICLGWLFMKKLDPNFYQVVDGKYERVKKGKGMWTNPSRSFIKLLSVRFTDSDDKKISAHMESVSDFLSRLAANKDIKRESINFYVKRSSEIVKKSNEGKQLYYFDLCWIGSGGEINFDLNEMKSISAKFLTFIRGEYTKPEIRDNLTDSDHLFFCIFMVYQLFQNIYEKQQIKNKDEAFQYGFYLDYWKVFNNKYTANAPQKYETQWPEEIVELASFGII